MGIDIILSSLIEETNWHTERLSELQTEEILYLSPKVHLQWGGYEIGLDPSVSSKLSWKIW